MSPHPMTQLAAARHDEFVADANRYRHYRQARRHTGPATAHRRRGRIARINAWIDTAQL